jgi:hypothetical protein
LPLIDCNVVLSEDLQVVPALISEFGFEFLHNGLINHDF